MADASYDPVAHAMDLTIPPAQAQPVEQSGGPAPGAFDSVAQAMRILQGGDVPDSGPIPGLTPQYTGTEKFGTGFARGFADTGQGLAQAWANIQAHLADDPTGEYAKKAEEINAEIKAQQKMYGPAYDSWQGKVGNAASKLPLALATGPAALALWTADGLAQPGSVGDRLASAGSNFITSLWGSGANTVGNKTVNAVAGIPKPEMANAYAKDVELRNATPSVQTAYSAAAEPSGLMKEAANFMTANGTQSSVGVARLQALKAKIQAQNKGLWDNVDQAAATAGNPVVDAAPVASSVQTFINDHGVSSLIAGAPDVPTAAQLMVLAKPELADRAVQLLIREGRTRPQAEQLVQGYLNRGTDIPFTDFRQMQKGMGKMSTRLSAGASPNNEAAAAAAKTYSSSFDALGSILTNPQSAAAAHWGPDLMDAFTAARNHSRDVAFPWETGHVRDPYGVTVNLPIINDLSNGVYSTNPNKLIKDILAYKNNDSLANYYGSVFDDPTKQVVNFIQGDPVRAAALANGQKTLASASEPSGPVGKFRKNAYGSVDRNPAYKNLMYASPGVVPPPPGASWPRRFGAAAQQSANVAIRAGLQSLSPEIGFGTVVAGTKTPGALENVRDYIKEHLLGFH